MVEKGLLFEALSLVAGWSDFLVRFEQSRAVYLGGRVGTGKTLMAVYLSAILHERGLVDATVANFPVAWATPIAEAPKTRVCYLLDELGMFMSARDALKDDSNQFRVTVTAVPRKLNSYTVISSRVVPDKSFRGLTVQRYYPWFGGASIWAYAEDEGSANNEGLMFVPSLKKYWPYYDTRFVPADILYIADHIQAATEEVKGDGSDPNRVLGSDKTPPPLRFFGTASKGVRGKVSGQGGSNGQDEGVDRSGSRLLDAGVEATSKESRFSSKARGRRPLGVSRGDLD